MKTLFAIAFLFVGSLVHSQTTGSGNALHFGSQNHYVQIAQNWPIDSFPFTAMAWIKAAPFTSTTSSPIINSHNSSTGYAGFLVHLVYTGGSYYLEGRLGSGGTGFASQNRKSKLVPFNHFNRWCHVAVVFNSLYSFDIYINGVLQSGSTTGAASTYNFNPTGLPRLGYSQSTPPAQQYFLGDLDEVSVWAIGLTQTQIRERMCKKIPVNSAGLVSYYKLNENTGSITSDSGPSGKNGTLTNASLRTLSGAPVGDEAAYFYPISSTTSMKLVNNSGDTIKVTNVTGSAQGVHVYTVNSAPNYQNGIVTNCPSNRYHGVFPVRTGTGNVNYQVEYRRPGYASSGSFSRDDNADTTWNANAIVQFPNGFNWTSSNAKEFISNTGPSAQYGSNVFGTTVQFTNTSASSSPMTYNWQFGDGTSSTAQNPQHYYTTGGTYWACLTATDTCGSQTFCDSISTNCGGTALFSSQQSTSLSVNFTNQSVGSGNLQFLWNFGDGTTSTIQNPQHYYTSVGNFWVCLSVTDTCGTQTFCDSVITTCNGSAAFGHQQTATRTVNFFNASTGTGTLHYLWDFGDGTSSTQANPSHAYPAEGNYWACLQTTDTCGTFTYCDSVEIVCFGLSSDYTYTQQNLTVSFTNLSTGIGTLDYVWDFGDGGYSFSKDPVYTYQVDGSYQVCLQTGDTCGGSTTCYTLDVCVLPSANFTAQNTAGFTFKFVPVTTNATSYIWDYGDGNFSTVASPTYTYQNKGLYQVCMYLIDTCGDADTCIDVLASLVDLDENEAITDLVIYPNPTNGAFKISLSALRSERLNVEVISSAGESVFVGDWSLKEGKENDIELDLRGQPRGLYLLKMTLKSGGVITRRIILH